MAAKITTVGDRVKLKKDDLLGIVRFIGPIKGKKGVFFGIELDKAKGKNNGSVKDISYFSCKKKMGLFTNKAGILKTNKKKNPDAPRITVGDKVKAIKVKTNGTVRWIGEPAFKPKSGTWYGIELEKPKGKSDGTVKGKYYFKCKEKSATFVQGKGLAVLGLGASSSSSSKKKDKKKGDKKKTTKKKKTEKPKAEEKKDENYVVGDKVEVKPNKKGQIRFVGTENDWGKDTTYFGIRFTEKRGDCDGEWKEIRKFYCPEGYAKYELLRNIKKKIQFDEDYMNEDEVYEKELHEKAEAVKKEHEKFKLLRDKFIEYDTDGNQSIDRSEFNKLAADSLGCSVSVSHDLFKQIDVSGNGEISFAEFDSWVDSIGGIDKLVKNDDDNIEEQPKVEEEEEPKAEEEPKDEEEPKADEEENNENENKEDEEPKEEENNDDNDKEDEAPKEEENNVDEPADDENNDENNKDDDGGDADDDNKPEENEN